MSGADLLAIGAILDQLAAGDLTEEVAAERLGWATMGKSPTCASCVSFAAGECRFPGRPPRPERAESVACHDYQKLDPRDTALPVTPDRRNCLFK
jgi:hypothetical protein